MDKLNIVYDASLSLNAEKSMQRLIQRREKINTKEYKRHKLSQKAARSQLKNRKEKSKGTTYCSNVASLSTPESTENLNASTIQSIAVPRQYEDMI